MTGINDINSAVYRLLAGDTELAGLCTIYKGGRRPAGYANPTLTATAARLERGEGAGMWICDIAVTIAADLSENGMPDHDTLDAVCQRVRALLANAELVLDGAKALPLIEGEQSAPRWDSGHTGEAVMEQAFGLVLIRF